MAEAASIACGLSRRAGAAAVAALLLLSGCSESEEPAPAPTNGDPVAEDPAVEEPGTAAAPQDSVTVVFTRDEAPAPVKRPVRGASREVRSALEWLVRGPTPEERSAGLTSWFSAETAGVLRSVEVDPDGHVVVDFHDLRPLIPNASTSAGSAMLLGELNRTIFQHPEVRSVEYRMEGSCDLFGEWLQYGCISGTPEGDEYSPTSTEARR